MRVQNWIAWLVTILTLALTGFSEPFPLWVAICWEPKLVAVRGKLIVSEEVLHIESANLDGERVVKLFTVGTIFVEKLEFAGDDSRYPDIRATKRFFSRHSKLRILIPSFALPDKRVRFVTPEPATPGGIFLLVPSQEIDDTAFVLRGKILEANTSAAEAVFRERAGKDR